MPGMFSSEKFQALEKMLRRTAAGQAWVVALKSYCKHEMDKYYRCLCHEHRKQELYKDLKMLDDTTSICVVCIVRGLLTI